MLALLVPRAQVQVQARAPEEEEEEVAVPVAEVVQELALEYAWVVPAVVLASELVVLC